MISIITVTYNRAQIIRGAIEGVLRQKYKNYEYIIVDGASKDNTIDILKEYEPIFEGRLRWISEPDKGLYDAINKGIRMAKGDVVGIINSDDFFHRDDTFDIIANAFEDKEIEAIYGDERDVDEVDHEHVVMIDKSAYFRTWMYRIGLMPPHQTFYARKSLFEKYGYYKTDYKIAADFELMLRFAYINHVNFKYVPESLLTFTTGGVSSQLSNKWKLNKETVRACKENGLFCCHPMIWVKYLFKVKKKFYNNYV